ncbi:MAG TPA: hypothetical protein VGX76_08240 [Pirellulales bacterium]|nr:hypothetical protein [Pirellulales bacterium]
MPDGDSLRTSVAARIDALCQQFEAAWQRGDRPAIDVLVEKADAADREFLRRELRRMVAQLESNLEAQLRSNCETDADASLRRRPTPARRPATRLWHCTWATPCRRWTPLQCAAIPSIARR